VYEALHPQADHPDTKTDQSMGNLTLMRDRCQVAAQTAEHTREGWWEGGREEKRGSFVSSKGWSCRTLPPLSLPREWAVKK